MNREEEIVAALVALGKAKATINLQSLRRWIEGLLNSNLPKTWEVTARQVLRTLEGVGMVRTKNQTIELTDSLLNGNLPGEVIAAKANEPNFVPQADSSTNGRIGGGGGSPPDGGGPNGDNGGDGFREVLGHPYLFALPEEEFDELLNAI